MKSKIAALIFFSCQLVAHETDNSMEPCDVPCCVPGPLYYTSCWCPIEVDFTLALDDFRSLPEGSWVNNWGAVAALNLRTFLPYCFTAQLAGSYGLYDWAGQASAPFANTKSLQQQGFITVAASRLTPDCSGFNAGVAYDWELNKHFGIFVVNPFLSQIRAQFGYLFQGGNELGFWGSYGINTSDETSQELPLKFRAVSQANLFWCHYFKNNGYTMVWAGTPYRRGLMYESGRPGNYIFGLQFSAPMTCSLSIEGHGAYMGPRGGSGVTPSKNFAADLCIGITYSFGKRRIQQSPYMTLANNSNLIVDTNQNF